MQSFESSFNNNYLVQGDEEYVKGRCHTQSDDDEEKLNEMSQLWEKKLKIFNLPSDLYKPTVKGLERKHITFERVELMICKILCVKPIDIINVRCRRKKRKEITHNQNNSLRDMLHFCSVLFMMEGVCMTSKRNRRYLLIDLLTRINHRLVGFCNIKNIESKVLKCMVEAHDYTYCKALKDNVNVFKSLKKVKFKENFELQCVCYADVESTITGPIEHVIKVNHYDRNKRIYENQTTLRELPPDLQSWRDKKLSESPHLGKRALRKYKEWMERYIKEDGFIEREKIRVKSVIKGDNPEIDKVKFVVPLKYIKPVSAKLFIKAMEIFRDWSYFDLNLKMKEIYEETLTKCSTLLKKHDKDCMSYDNKDPDYSNYRSKTKYYSERGPKILTAKKVTRSLKNHCNVSQSIYNLEILLLKINRAFDFKIPLSFKMLICGRDDENKVRKGMRREIRSFFYSHDKPLYRSCDDQDHDCRSDHSGYDYEECLMTNNYEDILCLED